MALTDRQIERYSRQIIVAGLGGVAQERLLAARIVLAGQPHDIEPVLYYLAGAGVGRIELLPTGDDRDCDRNCDGMIAHARALNAEVEARTATSGFPSLPLMLMLVGDHASLELARQFTSTAPLIVARLDLPARIVMADSFAGAALEDALRASFAERAGQADFVAMVAAAEAFKLLIQNTAPTPSVIEFDGYSARSRLVLHASAAS